MFISLVLELMFGIDYEFLFEHEFGFQLEFDYEFWFEFYVDYEFQFKNVNEL